MNRPSKIIRIFVCSTFKEFEKERNYLAKYVFPELRELCRRAGMVFRVVDLRWGISRQDSADHQTIPICLSEIRKCQEQSPDLNFLVMAGMDYGSILAPAEIPARDWALLMNDGGLDSDARSLLESCYRRDFNAEGSPYRLTNAGMPEAWIQAVLPPALEKAHSEKGQLTVFRRTPPGVGESTLRKIPLRLRHGTGNRPGTVFR